MSFSVVFRRIAKREFDDAISWYQDRREGLGREFSVAVEQQLEKIALSPTQFACVRGDIRRAVLQRFPYSILHTFRRRRRSDCSVSDFSRAARSKST